MANRWTDEEKRMLIHSAGHHSPELIAHLVGKSVSAVQNYARKQGISLGVERKHFTAKEDGELFHHLALGRPANAIARFMGRSVKSVRGRIAYLKKKQGDADAENS